MDKKEIVFKSIIKNNTEKEMEINISTGVTVLDILKLNIYSIHEIYSMLNKRYELPREAELYKEIIKEAIETICFLKEDNKFNKEFEPFLEEAKKKLVDPEYKKEKEMHFIMAKEKMDKDEGVFITKEQLEEKKNEAMKTVMDFLHANMGFEGIIFLGHTRFTLEIFAACICNDKDYIKALINDFYKFKKEQENE